MKNLKTFAFCMCFIVFLAIPVSATPYSLGYEWDRYEDFTTAVNPHNDQAGNKVWSYEHFTGQNFLNASLITSVAYPENPRWGNDQNNVSAWDQNVNYASWYPQTYSSLIRWKNPVGDNAVIDFTGQLRMWWGGWDGDSFVSYPMDVRMIMGVYDSSQQQYMQLKDEIVSSPFSAYQDNGSNFGNCPNVFIPVNYHVSMDLGDSFFWSAIPLRTVNKGCWITLNDNQMNIAYHPQVPEPGTLFLLGSLVAGMIGYKKIKL